KRQAGRCRQGPRILREGLQTLGRPMPPARNAVLASCQHSPASNQLSAQESLPLSFIVSAERRRLRAGSCPKKSRDFGPGLDESCTRLESAQKNIFSANWICRAGYDSVESPNWAVFAPKVALGSCRSVRLKMLKASARNWKLTASVTLMSL